MPPLVKPQLNLNGTSGADLLDGYARQLAALRDAQRALRDDGPNARDYQTHADPHAFIRAAEQHADRIARIQSVMDEIDSLAIAVDRQLVERAERAGRR